VRNSANRRTFQRQLPLRCIALAGALR
jgi:hypothetical protein